jgi:2-polyprenyl-6-methoxyphenol hydroxylase-like FAD-dependent oxidoreductase
MAEASRILITGGGIAGLSLAIALRRRGYTPELAEQCPRWPAAGAGIALHANAVRALRALGLGDAVSRAAAPLPRYGFYDQHGAQLCTTDLDDLWGQAGPCLGIARVRLQEILATAADGMPHRLGVAVTGLTQQRGEVSVTFADGSAGEYDLVVGADGIHSTVRGLAVSQKAPSYAWRSAAPSRPPISMTACQRSRKSSPSRGNGGSTAAWRPAACSPSPSIWSRRQRSPDLERLGMNGGCTHLERIPRCHALVRGSALSRSPSCPARSGAGSGICGTCGALGGAGLLRTMVHERDRVFVPGLARWAVWMMSAAV